MSERPGGANPLTELARWIEEARAAGAPRPAAAALATVGAGRPSARTISVKRIEPDALVFTSTLWSRKAREIESNPHVSLLFHWPGLDRQAHVAGTAAIAERTLAEQLFAERDTPHRLQTALSRQGTPIEPAELDELRARATHLAAVQEAPPPCPDDWGALRITPEAVELMSESPDRMHERRLFQRADDGWDVQLLSP